MAALCTCEELCLVRTCGHIHNVLICVITELSCFRIDISVKYVVENSGTTTVTVPEKSSAQRVMEVAADQDEVYDFTATYYGQYSDYFVDALVGKANGNGYYWVYYYQPPGELPYMPQYGIEQFIIPGTGGRLIWEYKHYGSTEMHPQMMQKK